MKTGIITTIFTVPKFEEKNIKAMETACAEITKDEMKKFAEWCSKKDYVFYPQEKKWFHVDGDALGTTDELLEEYLHQKSAG